MYSFRAAIRGVCSYVIKTIHPGEILFKNVLGRHWKKLRKNSKFFAQSLLYDT